MSDKIAKLEAELALKKAEAAFVDKKKAGKLTSKDRAELFALRQAFRENHRQPAKNGAAPAAIGAKAEAKL